MRLLNLISHPVLKLELFHGELVNNIKQCLVLSHTPFCLLCRYFASVFSRDERAEQTPEGEASEVAAKASRKLQLTTSNMDDEPQPQESAESSSPFSSSFNPAVSPGHRSPFRKRHSAQAECSKVVTETSAKKQLFAARGGDDFPSLTKFQYLGAKKLTTKVSEQQNPFERLDQSQKFISESDSENKCFLLTKTTEEGNLSSGESSALPQIGDSRIARLDMPSLRSGATETSDSSEESKSSFSYMSSTELISTYSDKLTASQEPSCSETEQTWQSRGPRLSEPTLPLVDLRENVPLNRRASFATSTTSSKV